MGLVPNGASMSECFVVKVTLQKVRNEILSGRPSGLVIDQAIAEAIEKGIEAAPFKP
ncbi:hypothetical protein [Corynebacterium diphtheriae]|uniref:hypothetical protein n=1 Tax=Corynebacterium diphtheriae TaxID=1717 RepID=UPI0013C5D587|nr:hypothetical protein [Corynebacterium diphtheriae]CAB0542961.1 hypothetical protein CIP107522_00708 [Corynebacterium diphtheriae]